jgi:hypothetical protein
MTTAARRLAESFVGELRDRIGTRLRSALLFGSAMRDEWIEGVSDVNVLILVDALDPALLADAAAPARQALTHGITPLFMELDEWRRAADVFSIELADMKEAGATLHGDDPVGSTVVHDTHMRLQAERELRAKLLHLHAGMLFTADEPERLGQLLMSALPSFLTYMRAALRLSGASVPRESRRVIEDACALAGADPAAFQAVLEARRSGGSFEPALVAGSVVAGFNEAAARLAGYIDTSGR